MNKLLWFLQVLLGIFFVFFGIQHYTLPEGLPAQMSWMYELPQLLHVISGSAELLGGLGLILPGLAKTRTRLTPLAASGLVVVMLGAMVFHLGRGELPNIVLNLILAALAGFIAYGRWKLVPLGDKEA